MPSAFEFGIEKHMRRLEGFFPADEPPRHGQDVGVVVLARKGGNLAFPAEGATHVRMLVGRYRDADARAADEDSERKRAILHLLRHRMGKVGIIHAVGAVGAEVLETVALLAQGLFKVFLELEAGVVATYAYQGIFVEHIAVLYKQREVTKKMLRLPKNGRPERKIF